MLTRSKQISIFLTRSYHHTHQLLPSSCCGPYPADTPHTGRLIIHVIPSQTKNWTDVPWTRLKRALKLVVCKWRLLQKDVFNSLLNLNEQTIAKVVKIWRTYVLQRQSIFQLLIWTVWRTRVTKKIPMHVFVP